MRILAQRRGRSIASKSFSLNSAALSAFLAAGVLSSSAALAQSANQQIAVVVNQVPVVFRGAPPQEVNNSVLVPLRGVFEQLGATVGYDPAAKQIQARKGATLVILTIGQASAYVGGVPATLSQPAIVTPDGTTLVPLRFVAQAFGADVAWLPSSHTVVVNTVDQHVASLLPPPLGTDGTATGTVTEVYLSTNPATISLRINGSVYSAPLAASTVILVDRGRDNPAVQGTLRDLHEGDQVEVTESSAGAPASVIRVQLARLSGTVKSIAQQPDGSALIVLNDGQSRRVQSSAPVTMAGQPITLSDILPSERVTLHLDPATGDVTSVDLPKGGGYAGSPDESATTSSGARKAQIRSFTVDAAPLLRGGDTISATLHGTRGATGTFSIPGVVESVPMQESSPGVYHATYKVPMDANVTGGSVLGALRVGGGGQPSGPLLQAAETVTIDNTPPKITERNPSPNATVGDNRPKIYAVTQDDDGSGISASKTRLLVDGNDVTDAANITAAFVTYQPKEPLTDGSHSVSVLTVDRVGNRARSDWHFLVSAGPGVVTSFDSNLLGGNSTLLAGQPLNVTLRAQPGGAASFSVGSVVSDIPMQETQPGIYTGTYLPRAGVNAESLPVVARYTSSSGTTIASTLSQTVSIDAGVPAAPTITQPTPGAAVGDEVVLKGTATARAQVSVTVIYHAKQLGLFDVSGRAAETEVAADDSGHWSTGKLRLGSPGALTLGGVTYTARVTQSVANGQHSEEESVVFRHG